LACDKPDPITPPDPPKPEPKIFDKIWSTRIYEAPLENVGSDNAYIYKNLYLVTGDGWSHEDPSIYAYDTKSGLLQWRWQQSGRLQSAASRLVGQDNILILNGQKGILALNIETQEMIWEEIHKDFNQVGNTPILINSNYAYKINHFENYYGEASIIRYNIYTGKREVVYIVPIENQWSPSLSPPAFWIDPDSKDTIMVVINGKSQSGFSPQQSPTDLLAINLRTKSLVWKMENIMEVRTNLGRQPVIYQNSIIFGGDRSIYSVDIPTAKVNWRTPFYNLAMVGNFNSTGLLLVEDRVFANPDVHDVMCLNAATGAVIWHNKTDAPNCTPNMLYNDDMLIFTSWGFGSVMILDPKTGQKIHKEKSEKIYTTDVLYDKTTDMYFVQDYASAVGFKINKPK
jgi:outer membrane protein assembly factor BamB